LEQDYVKKQKVEDLEQSQSRRIYELEQLSNAYKTRTDELELVILRLKNEFEELKKGFVIPTREPRVDIPTLIEVAKEIGLETNENGELYVTKKEALEALILKIRDVNPDFNMKKSVVWTSLSSQSGAVHEGRVGRRPCIVLDHKLFN
jgi:cob(I)alamin adenosyltransferase